MRVTPEGGLGVMLQLPVVAQTRLMATRWELESGPDEIAAVARAADRAGFFALGVCDHVAIPREHVEQMRTTWYDPIATLGMVAGITDQARLVTHVYVPAYRHPLVAAKGFATLDRLSGGRVIVGVGAGHVEREFETLDVPFHDRGPRLDESIDVLDAALRDEWPDTETERFAIHDMGMAPRPVQRPRPPIWVGGSSDAALRRAAERGDGWLPQGTWRTELPERIETLRRFREASGLADEPMDVGSMSEPYYVGEPSWDVGDFTTSGPAEKIAESLIGLRDMGATFAFVAFRTRSCDELIDQVEAFGTEVLPLVNS